MVLAASIKNVSLLLFVNYMIIVSKKYNNSKLKVKNFNIYLILFTLCISDKTG